MDYFEKKSDYAYWIEEISPDGKWFVSFEDNGRVAYLYLGKMNGGEKSEIHDDLWIYNMIYPPIEECKEVFIIWSEDSAKTALVVDEECWGMYDLKSWRKMRAPRVDNRIESIPRENWDLGVTKMDGETYWGFLSSTK